MHLDELLQLRVSREARPFLLYSRVEELWISEGVTVATWAVHILLLSPASERQSPGPLLWSQQGGALTCRE